MIVVRRALAERLVYLYTADPPDAVTVVLEAEAVIRLVAAADAELREYGVTGVPLFIIGRADGQDDSRRLAVSGAQGAQALLQQMAVLQEGVDRHQLDGRDAESA